MFYQKNNESDLEQKKLKNATQRISSFQLPENKTKNEITASEPSSNPTIDRKPIDDLVSTLSQMNQNYFKIDKLPTELGIFQSTLQVHLAEEIKSAQKNHRNSFELHKFWFKFASNEIVKAFVNAVTFGKYPNCCLFNTNRQKNLENISKIFNKPNEHQLVDYYAQAHAAPAA